VIGGQTSLPSYATVTSTGQNTWSFSTQAGPNAVLSGLFLDPSS
jgi:hypothetical protein